ncbi:MAG: hypothetical protein P4L10_00265 [Acidobacteriaceae bacterium]|nr:hypothetical protein [Acidobacteriaceae bacterium]
MKYRLVTLCALLLLGGFAQDALATESMTLQDAHPLLRRNLVDHEGPVGTLTVSRYRGEGWVFEFVAAPPRIAQSFDLSAKCSNGRITAANRAIGRVALLLPTCTLTGEITVDLNGREALSEEGIVLLTEKTDPDGADLGAGLGL